MFRRGRCGKIAERKDDRIAKKTKKPSQKMQAWIDSRKRQPWKLPLPQFIEQLYFKRFGKTAPDTVLSVEERCRLEVAKKESRRTHGGVPWTAQPRVKLYYVDGEQIT